MGSVGFNQVQTLPSTLIEHMLILPSSMKPLYLIELLRRNRNGAGSKLESEPLATATSDPQVQGPIKNALVFTKSLESAKRLVSLLRNFEEIYAQAAGSNGKALLQIREYSSDLNKGEKKTILKDFRDGKIDMWVEIDSSDEHASLWSLTLLMMELQRRSMT